MPTGPLAEQLAGKQSPTQLGRALHELGIRQIPAFSPQAKGRIERAWRTCQDRLVSELRLARATTLQQANAVLERFCADYNQRFAHPAADATRDFRSLPRRFDLARCLSLRYQRVVAADHVVTLGAHSISLPPCPVIVATPDKRWNFPISSTAPCASIAATFCYSPSPCRCRNTGSAVRLRAPRRRNQNPRCPASTTSPAARL
jgi:hypothetical protein